MTTNPPLDLGFVISFQAADGFYGIKISTYSHTMSYVFINLINNVNRDFYGAHIEGGQ
jgi:hypothetical protein